MRKLNREQLSRVQALSRKERLRAIWEAEGIVAPPGSGISSASPEPELAEARMLAGAAWHELMSREQVLMFSADQEQKPPDAPRRFDSRSASGSRAKKRGVVLFPLLGAAAALIIAFGVARLFPGFSAGLFAPADTIVEYTTILSAGNLDRSTILAAPGRLDFPGGAVRILDGYTMIVPGREASQDLYAAVLRARFDFAEPVRLRLHHSFATLTVTGTRFTVDFSPGYGAFTVQEGSVEFEHHAYVAKGPTAVIRGPGHVVFDAKSFDGTSLRSSVPPAERGGAGGAREAGAQVVQQEFLLRDGTSVIGRVIRGNRDALYVQTREGEVREVLKKDLRRTRMLQ